MSPLIGCANRLTERHSSIITIDKELVANGLLCEWATKRNGWWPCIQLVNVNRNDSTLKTFSFLLRTRNSVRGFVRPSIRGDRVEKWKNERCGYFLCMFVYGVGFGLWMGVGCPCPPVRNDIVTPRHLFFLGSGIEETPLSEIKIIFEHDFIYGPVRS